MTSYSEVSSFPDAQNNNIKICMIYTLANSLPESGRNTQNFRRIASVKFLFSSIIISLKLFRDGQLRFNNQLHFARMGIFSAQTECDSVFHSFLFTLIIFEKEGQEIKRNDHF